jgi:hypothetical protein
MSLTVGSEPLIAGYVCKARDVRGQSPSELERRLGYRTGRLEQGWYFLFLLRLPTISDFEFRGYTHLSDGIPKGGKHPPEDVMRREGWSGIDIDRMKRKLIENGTLTVTGFQRLAKVVPVIRHTDAETYPPGSGIPQWRLKNPLPFKVKAHLGPSQAYLGDYT